MATTVRVDTDIQAPPERVWSLLVDFAAYPQWNPFVTTLEGDVREGAPLRACMSIGGKVIPARIDLSRVAPNRELAWTGGFTPRFLLHAVHAFRLEPLETGGVRLVHEEVIGGLLSPLMMWRMGKDLREQFQRLNAALKRRAEGA
jgi:hypothetical protein